MNITVVEKNNDREWIPFMEESTGVNCCNEVGLLNHQKLMIATNASDDHDEIKCPFIDNFDKWSCPSFSDDYHKCEKCEIIFANEETLKTHLKTKHPDRTIVKRYKCDICAYSSDRSCDFKYHMLTHTKEKPFECSVCFKKFSRKCDLKGHFRIHTKETPYECNRCGRKFRHLSNLKTHERSVHDKLRPHVCKVCGSTFGHVGNYRIHMLTHINAKSYKCEECTAAFNNPSHLRRHMITGHTKDFPHKCSLCGKGYIMPNRLKKHFSQCSQK